NLSECSIIIDYLADGVYHVGGFVIHITAAFFLYTVMPGYRLIILYPFPDTGYIFSCCIFTIKIFSKKCFTIIGKPFMHPHISHIFSSYIISKPFMARLMYNDKIPFQSLTAAGKISS